MDPGTLKQRRLRELSSENVTKDILVQIKIMRKKLCLYRLWTTIHIFSGMETSSFKFVYILHSKNIAF
jgi:hypothetical protein